MNNIFLYYIILINIIGIAVMYIDKSRAIKKQWRISESTLLLISVLGGSIGSLFGMYCFHHKTKHKKFTTGIPLILIVQVVLLFRINI